MVSMYLGMRLVTGNDNSIIPYPLNVLISITKFHKSKIVPVKEFSLVDCWAKIHA